MLGPPPFVYIDGEAARAAQKNEIGFVFSPGTEQLVRALGQHAGFAERHGAMLRCVVNTMTGQTKEDSQLEPMQSMVAPAMFALNAMTHDGHSTPYQAVFGRQPDFLPPTEGQAGFDSTDGRKEQRT